MTVWNAHYLSPNGVGPNFPELVIGSEGPLRTGGKRQCHVLRLRSRVRGVPNSPSLWPTGTRNTSDQTGWDRIFLGWPRWPRISGASGGPLRRGGNRSTPYATTKVRGVPTSSDYWLSKMSTTSTKTGWDRIFLGWSSRQQRQYLLFMHDS